jgi:uncharacterized protein YjbI with pentapeptide repeats
MANAEHTSLLKECARQSRGFAKWRDWRKAQPDTIPDLGGDDFQKLDLTLFDLRKAIITESNFSRANLSRANLSDVSGTKARFIRTDLSNALLRGGRLHSANLEAATLSKADLTKCNLDRAVLSRADLSLARLDGASLVESDLTGADLSEATLEGACLNKAFLTAAILTKAKLINAKLRAAVLNRALLLDAQLCGADLSESRIFGTSVWNVDLTGAIQSNLVLPLKGYDLSFQHLGAAQFFYLQMTNKEFGPVIDALSEKSALLLGRFSPERKVVLENIKTWLLEKPPSMHAWLFDFEKPESKTLIEAVAILGSLSRFVIADVTDPQSVPLELATLVSELTVPFAILVQAPSKPFSMLEDLFRKYPGRLAGIYPYRDLEDLREQFEKRIRPDLNAAAEHRRARNRAPVD